MVTHQLLNTNSEGISHSDLDILRKKCLENKHLMKYYISKSEEEEWIAFKNRLTQTLIIKTLS